MKKTLLAAAALAALTACGKQEAPATATEAPVAAESGINLEYMDTSVRPGDDFFTCLQRSADHVLMRSGLFHCQVD